MAEYVIGKVVVKIHGDVDQKRIEQACQTYLNNIGEAPQQKKENEKK